MPDTSGIDKTLVYCYLVHVSSGIHSRMYEDKQWSWVCCKYPTEMNTLHVIQGFSKATPSRITDTHVLLMIPRNFELKISS